MRSEFDGSTRLALPRPSRALWATMLALLCIWVLFAVGLNWGGASLATFEALAGSTEHIAHGELWRLFTAPLLHSPESSQGVQHILFALLGIYFLAPALEATWGTPRLLRFLALSALLSYAIQLLLDLLLPAAWSERLVPPLWFGSTPVLEALVIAFALSLKNRQVLLFFVIPVGSKALVAATIGISVLLLIADALGPAGHIAPFAGVFAGWFLGGGTPSPARKLWLRWRLGRLDREARAPVRSRGRELDRSRLRVIEGGQRPPRGPNHGKGGPTLH